MYTRRLYTYNTAADWHTYIRFSPSTAPRFWDVQRTWPASYATKEKYHEARGPETWVVIRRALAVQFAYMDTSYFHRSRTIIAKCGHTPSSWNHTLDNCATGTFSRLGIKNTSAFEDMLHLLHIRQRSEPTALNPSRELPTPFRAMSRQYSMRVSSAQ